jgi:hypothetical protein
VAFPCLKRACHRPVRFALNPRCSSNLAADASGLADIVGRHFCF